MAAPRTTASASTASRPAGQRCARPGLLVVALLLAVMGATSLEAASARLDLDVDPEEARVYLDGKYRGVADDFDDSPDYLWVAPGRHTLELRHDDHHTLRIYFAVASGQHLRFDDELEETDDRPRRTIESNRLPPSPPPSGSGPAPSPPAEPAATVAFLRFEVEPGDAAVWLDGIFLGPADRFEGNPERARVAPGRHTVELTRPGYRGVVLEVDLGREEERSIRIVLEPAAE